MKVILKLLSVVFIVFVMNSCGTQSEEVKIPENVINKKEFSAILADILVLEGYKSRIYKKRDSLKYDMRSFYKGVLEKHGTDKITYDRSYEFYSTHSELMYEVFQMAETKFKLKEDQLNVEKKEAELKEDKEEDIEEFDTDPEAANTSDDSSEGDISDSTSHKNLLNLEQK